MLVECWASVVDAGPTLNQHWFKVLCLRGYSKSKQMLPFGFALPYILVAEPCQRGPVYATLFGHTQFTMTRCGSYAALMLGQRRRLWPSNIATLVQRMMMCPVVTIDF